MRSGDLEHFGPVATPQERFTPGPWHIDPNASGFDGWPIRAKQGPIDVCPAKAHGLADAHLIAAAPELYREGRASARTMDDVADALGERGLLDLADELRVRARLLRLACLKAEGH